MVACTASITSRASRSTRSLGVSLTAANGDLSAWNRSVAEAPEAAALALAEVSKVVLKLVTVVLLVRIFLRCSAVGAVASQLVGIDLDAQTRPGLHAQHAIADL